MSLETDYFRYESEPDQPLDPARGRHILLKGIAPSQVEEILRKVYPERTGWIWSKTSDGIRADGGSGDGRGFVFFATSQNNPSQIQIDEQLNLNPKEAYWVLSRTRRLFRLETNP